MSPHWRALKPLQYLHPPACILGSQGRVQTSEQMPVVASVVFFVSHLLCPLGSPVPTMKTDEVLDK